MSDTKIEPGDVVNIAFPGEKYLIGCTVLSVPSATGEAWVLRDVGGNLQYVQQFEVITRKNLPQ